MAKRKSTEAKLAVIKAAKERGDVTRLSNKFGLSVAYVSSVINGRLQSDTLVDKIYKALSHRPSFKEAIQGGSLKA